MFTRYQKSLVSTYSQFLFVFLIVFVLVLSPDQKITARASEITLNVDTFVDSNDPAHQVCSASPGDCSLRGAISIANIDLTNRYLINIPSGTYSLSLPNASEDDNNGGDLDIKGDITLTGIEEGVTIMGNQVDRVLHILPNAEVFIDNIQISGGRSPDGVDESGGESGGGIYNQGNLILKNCLVQGNQAGNGAHATDTLLAGEGGWGGGIQNNGHITIENSVLSNNAAGTGGNGYVCPAAYLDAFCWTCSKGGNGGVGGGISNAGVLTISNSTLENNSAGLAGLPGICVSWYVDVFYYGQPGYGGGIWNQNYISLVGSNLTENQGRLSGGGLSNQGIAYLSDTSIVFNNASEGGGLSNQNYLEIEESMVVSNTSNKGGGIYNEDELHMFYSTLIGNDTFLGGGIYNQGEAILTGVNVKNNWTRNGPDGEDETGCIKMPCPPTDGGSPHGGGIYNSGEMQLDQGELSGNSTGDGGKGGDSESWDCANGGDGGFGGGIYNTGSITINFTPVISNTTGEGGEGGTCLDGDGLDGMGGFGGGIYNAGLMSAMFSDVSDNQSGTGNGGSGRGGGIANQGNLTYSFGTILDNLTNPSGDGGGIYSSSPFTITSSTVANNAAGGRGGGIFTNGGILYGANNLIASNTIDPENQGSGLYIHSTDARLLHTTLSQNGGGDGSGIAIVEAGLQMTNTILVSHTIGINVALGAEAILENTLWGDQIWANKIDWAGNGDIITGTNNVRLDPGFIDPSNLDYHIDPTSAAIDRGTPTTVSIDLDNQPRPNPATGVVDLGADEYWEFTSVFEVDITGPLTGTTYAPIKFTAVITPEEATPNILYFWVPTPESGQWTNDVNYQWMRPGEKTIEVSAISNGIRITDRFTISLDAGIIQLFFPIVFR